MHVCGNFVKNTVIPDDKTSVDVSTELDDALKEQLNSVLNASIGEHDIEPFRHSKKLYRACMNQGNKFFLCVFAEMMTFFCLAIGIVIG
jgi:predicted metalloendopeptidase